VTHQLLKTLETSVADGRKLLVPYLMAGLPDRESFPLAYAATQRYADVVEVGLPYSDPLMDGPVIAAAGERAIRSGVGPIEAIEMSGSLDGTVPRLYMTYYNPIHRVGEERFCSMVAASGAAGLIVPDLPVEESRSLRDAAAANDLAWVPLVAPTSSPERVKAITETATGFVYAVSTLGVTGTREALSDRAARVVEACREATDKPILVGIGVSNADQARAAASTADGVVVGSAVVRTILEEGPKATELFLGTIRAALDDL
jgi:tryptophan synthase alpha chain